MGDGEKRRGFSFPQMLGSSGRAAPDAEIANRISEEGASSEVIRVNFRGSFCGPSHCWLFSWHLTSIKPIHRRLQVFTDGRKHGLTGIFYGRLNLRLFFRSEGGQHIVDLFALCKVVPDADAKTGEFC